jgi:hypothetical protein
VLLFQITLSVDPETSKKEERKRKIADHMKERESLRRTIAPIRKHIKPLDIEKKKFKKRK